MRSYSHQEHDKRSILNIDNMLSRMQVTGAGNGWERLEIDGSCPVYVRENIEAFADFILPPIPG